MDLNILRDAVYKDAVEHGLWEDTEKFCRELADESGPAKREDDERYYRRVEAAKHVFFEADELLSAAEEDHWDDVQEELADVIIMALSTAGFLGIDVDEAVKAKMERNKTRPWKHEGEKHED